jgi:phenylalanyl-tRNA synthetase alpha chain
MSDTASLEADLLAQVDAAADLAALEAVRVAALGKTGSVSQLLKSLGAMSPEERKARGPEFNALRDRVQSAIAARREQLENEALERQLAAEAVDLTLPPPPRRKGSVHPTMQVMDELIAIFAEMGFAVAEGPDIEDDWHNFTALNFPPRHPARDSSCAPTRARSRCAPCRRASRRSGSSRPAVSIGRTTTRPTRRCSTKSKGW